MVVHAIFLAWFHLVRSIQITMLHPGTQLMMQLMLLVSSLLPGKANLF